MRVALLEPNQAGPFAPVHFRPADIGTVLTANAAALPSTTGSNPGTRAVTLAFHRHVLRWPTTLTGVRIGVTTQPNPATIKMRVAIYAADETNGFPSSVLHSSLQSAETAFSASVATPGDRYLDLAFTPTRVDQPRAIWVALMCEHFYTASDTTLGIVRGNILRTAICGTVGSYFDRDLVYVGAGVTSISSAFPSGIASASNFAMAADGTLANAMCGLMAVRG